MVFFWGLLSEGSGWVLISVMDRGVILMILLTVRYLGRGGVIGVFVGSSWAVHYSQLLGCAQLEGLWGNSFAGHYSLYWGE